MPSVQMSLRSYAKINLGLHVLGKRTDGYHEIRTILQGIGLHDRLDIERTRGRGISFISDCRELDVHENLVVKAIRMFSETAHVSGRFEVHLRKRIPLGAGLGGGSSNAAVVLLGLNRMFGGPLDWQEMVDCASQLGSDVPFFLVGGRALAVGRGSEVYPLVPERRKPVLLAIPRVRVSTPDAYRRLSLQLTKRRPVSMIPVFCSDYLRALDRAKPLENHFESVVFSELPWLKALKKEWLKCGAEAAGLTGSGSGLFGMFDDTQSLSRAIAAVQRKDLRLIQTFTLNRAQYQKGIYKSVC